MVGLTRIHSKYIGFYPRRILKKGRRNRCRKKRNEAFRIKESVGEYLIFKMKAIVCIIQYEFIVKIEKSKRTCRDLRDKKDE